LKQCPACHSQEIAKRHEDHVPGFMDQQIYAVDKPPLLRIPSAPGEIKRGDAGQAQLWED
jgi:hypothetical protein